MGDGKLQQCFSFSFLTSQPAHTIARCQMGVSLASNHACLAAASGEGRLCFPVNEKQLTDWQVDYTGYRWFYFLYI
jgi:hypothetical protein